MKRSSGDADKGFGERREVRLGLGFLRRCRLSSPWKNNGKRLEKPWRFLCFLCAFDDYILFSDGKI